MVDDRLRIVLGQSFAVGALLSLHRQDGKRETMRVAEMNPDTMEAVLEPIPQIEITLTKAAAYEYRPEPAPSKYLPGNPQPWKRRRK